MKIYLGADHRGFKLKAEIKPWLIGLGYEVIDLGAKSYNPGDDYVDFAVAVARSVSAGAVHRSPFTVHSCGILLCGSGVGMEIAANRVKGIRCGLGLSPAQVASAREDDDINILSLAADYTDIGTAKNMVTVFLETAFSGEEKYLRRLEKIDKLFVIASDPDPGSGERGDLVGIATSSPVGGLLAMTYKLL